jgi:glutamate N-acetyltransferase/amino-acid N-acetyltransferase
VPVNLNLPLAQPVDGVDWATLAAGVKADSATDMAVAYLCDTATCSAVFTKSAFSAAPVTICRQHMQACDGAVRALLINSGNANGGTGEPGIVMAQGHCRALARSLSIPESSVLPFSTGVIGQLLPDAAMLAGIEKAAAQIAEKEPSNLQAWESAARAIMTTDTQPKLTSQQLEIAGQIITITGMAKGAGMIQPNMATMLSYIFCDASIEKTTLDTALSEAVGVSFNAITVDSDTSTNDSCVLIATGQSGVTLAPGHADWPTFMQALKRVFIDLAQAIIRDAEGATKFISVHVSGGQTVAECKQVAYAIANSPLVKTAMFASDANVGRLLMAIGKAGVEGLDGSKVSVSIGDVLAFEAGGIAAAYTEEKGTALMQRDEIDVHVHLARGAETASVYTSDLSHDYVSINADYRS